MLRALILFQALLLSCGFAPPPSILVTPLRAVTMKTPSSVKAPLLPTTINLPHSADGKTQRVDSPLLAKEDATIDVTSTDPSAPDVSAVKEEMEEIDWKVSVPPFLFPALGGLLFGYDIGATSGAAIGLENAGLAPGGVGPVASLSLVGALAGSVVAAIWGDAIGRRKELMAASLLYAAGAVTVALASNVIEVDAGRVLTGLGIGLAMHAAPAYIAETAPSSVRGFLISLKEGFIVIGILLGYVACYSQGSDLLQGSGDGFRVVYGAALPVALVLGAGMWSLPASPRWLALSGGKDIEVENALRRLRPPDVSPAKLEKELEGITELVNTEREGEGESLKILELVTSPRLRKPFLIGTSLVVFQQITGQPSVLYYATKIFNDAGFPLESASAVSILLGVFKLLTTGISVGVVESAGRRPLLLWGVSGMVVSLITLSFCTSAGTSAAIGSVISLLLYVGCYQFSFGPITWAINGEIYPASVRTQALAIASMLNFGSNAVVGYLLPSLQNSFGMANIYLLFAGIGLLSLLSIYLTVPETKGKTLEEIEAMF